MAGHRRLCAIMLWLSLSAGLGITEVIRTVSGAWLSSTISLPQTSYNAGPALLYKSGTMYLAFHNGLNVVNDLHILASTDLSTWIDVDTISGSASAGGKMGFIYNPVNNKMYISYLIENTISDFPIGGVDYVGNFGNIAVISSTDGISWSKPTNLTVECDGCEPGAPAWQVQGPGIVFDSISNRLVVEYAKVLTSPPSSCTCTEVFLNESYGPNFNTWSSLGSNPVSFGGTPLYPVTTPDLEFVNGVFYLAYEDNGGPHIMQSTDGITWSQRATLNGQLARSVVIGYSPAESAFHAEWVGTDGSYTINDMNSPDAISWGGQVIFNGQNGQAVAESELYPALSFDPAGNVLVMAFTGTDCAGEFNFGQPCNQGHVNVLSQSIGGPVGGQTLPDETALLISYAVFAVPLAGVAIGTLFFVRKRRGTV